MDTSSSISFR